MLPRQLLCEPLGITRTLLALRRIVKQPAQRLGHQLSAGRFNYAAKIVALDQIGCGVAGADDAGKSRPQVIEHARAHGSVACFQMRAVQVHSDIGFK
jgi:hypothetical protein